MLHFLFHVKSIFKFQVCSTTKNVGQLENVFQLTIKFGAFQGIFIPLPNTPSQLTHHLTATIHQSWPIIVSPLQFHCHHHLSLSHHHQSRISTQSPQNQPQFCNHHHPHPQISTSHPQTNLCFTITMTQIFISQSF